MQIETFECQETAAEPIEASEEAIRIIKELGLEGQKSFSAKTAEGFASRCPYRLILDEESRVYRELCPRAERLERYQNSPIPLRVLQVAAHAKQSLTSAAKEGETVWLWVWDRASAAEKDPVLVAYVGRYEWNISGTYLLARWGEVLESFPVLMKRAAEQCRARLAAQAEQVVASIRSASEAQIVGASLALSLGEG